MTFDLENFVQDIIKSLVDPQPTTVAVRPGFVQGKVTVPIIQAPHDTNLKVQPPAQAVVKPAAKPLILPTLVPLGKWTAASMTAEILKNEGGYVNDPSDAGKATNYGITIGFMNAHKDFFGLNAAATDKDVRGISPTTAVKAYLTFFFTAGHYDQLPNQSNIVMQLYDLSVNTGVRYSDGESPATKVLQHALAINADGVLGPTTLTTLAAAITKSGADFVNDAIVDARVNFYTQVVAAHPEDAKFLEGWKTRANKYRV